MARSLLEGPADEARQGGGAGDGVDGLEVRPVIDLRQLRALLDLPRQLYRGDGNYAPPHRASQRRLLTPGRSPFLEHIHQELFLAYRRGRVVGRIGAFRDHHRRVGVDAWVGEFGLFECEDDVPAAVGLLQAARRTLERLEIDSMVGPVNLSTNLDCGLLVDSDGTPPWTMMPHNPLGYQRLLEAAGARREMDLLVYRLRRADDGGRLRAVARRARQKAGIEILALDKRRYPEQMAVFSQLYNRCWEHNKGFVPLTPAEVQFFIDEFRSILDPQLVRIAYVRGAPVGFSLALPDINPILRTLDRFPGPFGLAAALVQSWLRHPRHARLMTLGVVPEHRRSGLTAALLVDTVEAAWRRGYDQMEFSWMLEDNRDALGYLEAFGARLTHRYRLYRLGGP